MNRDLAAGRWGFVQIAVAAYVYLLEHLSPGDSSLFGKEVICQRVAKPVHFYSGLTACAGGKAMALSTSSEGAVSSTADPSCKGQLWHASFSVMAYLKLPAVFVHGIILDGS